MVVDITVKWFSNLYACHINLKLDGLVSYGLPICISAISE